MSNTPTLAMPQSSVLDRTGWIASGSKNSNSANNAIDGKEDTRWTSGSQKEPGDWFKVETNKNSISSFSTRQAAPMILRQNMNCMSLMTTLTGENLSQQEKVVA